MGFRKIWGPASISCFAGPIDVPIEMEAEALGQGAKRVSYHVKVLAKSGSFQFSLRLDHGPRPDVLVTHSTPIAMQAPPTTPSLVVGDADASLVLGAYLRPVVTASSGNATAQTAWIEIYEVTNPF